MAKAKSIHQERALDIHEDVGAWVRTSAGLEFLCVDYVSVYRRMPAYSWASDKELIRALEPHMNGVLGDEQAGILGSTPVYCTTDYTSMLLTMSASAPKNSITTVDVSSPAGFLVFQDAVDIDAGYGLTAIRAVRALSWYVLEGLQGPGMVSLVARVWTEAKRIPSIPRIQSREKLFPGPMAATVIGQNSGPDHPLVRVLQAHFALLKSPLVKDESATRNPKVSPRTKRSLTDDFRRVYLRHPEYARYEADEAAAAREGRAPMRAHWVRGHWRNQRYAKANQNRWIWIAGFIKGNPEVGTVSSRKVGVARASATELKELVSALGRR